MLSAAPASWLRVQNLAFTDKELTTIDELLGTTTATGVDLWKDARDGTL